MGQMVRRLFPLVLALLVGGAPMAIELCEIHCTEPVAHACSHAAARGNSVTSTVVPVPHACGHSEALPTISAPQPQLVLDVSAVTPEVFRPVEAMVGSAGSRDESPPPGPIPLTLLTPLRV